MSELPLRPDDRIWAAVTRAAVALGVGVLALGLIWLPGLPAHGARVGADYAFFVPNLLAGTFWARENGLTSLPWFTPAQCGGFALHADPQGVYLSITQALAVAFGPWQAVRISFLVYGALGGAGAAWLARAGFGLSRPSAVLAGVLFMFNGFYAVRMMVGHLGFAPFMLSPALAACVVGPAGRGWRGETLRVAGAGLLLAAQIQGGMAALLAPCLLSIVVVAVMHALASGGAVLPAFVRMGRAGLLGVLLCAGRLAAMVALLGNLPRDAYALPGYDSVLTTCWVALRTVFVSPCPDMPPALHSTHVHPFLHEFDYGVGPAAFLLMLAWAWMVWRRPVKPNGRTMLLWGALGLMLIVPLSLNTYGPQWSALLKTLPVLRQSTLLLRWFAAYILPAALGAALALDRLQARGAPGALLCAAGSACTLVALLLTVGGGRSFPGAYDPEPVQRAWDRATETGHVPAVARLEAPAHAADGFTGFLDRQNALAHSASALGCYQPLFGYGLENFSPGALHAGRVTDRAGGGLNMKNPACYVFPSANGCHPGDTFAPDQAASAVALASYRPFVWRKPAWARAADWLGLASFACVLAASAWALAGRGRA